MTDDEVIIELLSSSSEDEEEELVRSAAEANHQNNNNYYNNNNNNNSSEAIIMSDQVEKKDRKNKNNNPYGGDDNNWKPGSPSLSCSSSNDAVNDSTFSSSNKPQHEAFQFDNASTTSSKKRPRNYSSSNLIIHNPYAAAANKKKTKTPSSSTTATAALSSNNKKKKQQTTKNKKNPPHPQELKLQAGLVLYEDVNEEVKVKESSFDDSASCEPQPQPPQDNVLFEDAAFPPSPRSIQGQHKQQGAVIKCRCSPPQPAKLSFKVKGPNPGRPYHHCARQKCRYFAWAYTAELKLHWYRFGPHNGYRMVQQNNTNNTFSAQDLRQGKLGDCWFLSALAVIAERPDLIQRLIPIHEPQNKLLQTGQVHVNLFVDGFWKRIALDNFLPCLMDETDEAQLQQALQASRMENNPRSISSSKQASSSSSSKYDPFAMSDTSRQVLRDTHEKLDQLRGPSGRSRAITTQTRVVTTDDLAYSKAQHQQLWVPLLEKAYAKMHGCYSAISGGHIAEAFLDLTGAPTVVHHLQNTPSQRFDPKAFWYQLLQYRRQRLPMGCGTDSSAAGIIGMHAYSILDVREIPNVSVEFFREQLQTRTLGNVSGFTEFDGTVRLLHIRNPHGKGEWKGDFSDQSSAWERLLRATSNSLNGLDRSMRNDGCFWIDYDSFLMGFSNVDVVLAFEGNHAKSFASNFPPKNSNHRCTRAFEVSLLDVQPGVPNQTDQHVELYCMGIQKNKRGASSGRADRKKSYKVCDLGMLVGKFKDNDITSSSNFEFESVEGQLFGFRRDGHYKLVLDRKQQHTQTRWVVMPISFGHPAATDDARSFAVRFVADSPLLIRELPAVPRMDQVLQQFCFPLGRPPQPSLGVFSRSSSTARQGQRKVIYDDTEGILQYGMPRFRIIRVDCLANQGGVVMVYLCVNNTIHRSTEEAAAEFTGSLEATCRGMMCRTSTGFVEHETLADKGRKQFEAAWRKFTVHFSNETRSRLLMVLVQSGQHTEMGTVTCRPGQTLSSGSSQASSTTTTTGKENSSSRSQTRLTSMFSKGSSGPSSSTKALNFETLGIFHPIEFSKEEARELFSTTNNNASSSVIDIQEDDRDFELEAALAISQQDSDLLEVIERSKADASSFGRSSSCARFEEDDIEKAIRLSLQERPMYDLIEILDDDDDDDEDKKQPAIPTPANDDHSAAPTVEEKRRLAAEAAARRFQ